MNSLSEINSRYSRQISLPEIGEVGQRRLADARVLLVGVGGLGSPIALYLTAAGVGHLGLVDSDVVSLSNLQRQVLYAEDEVGLPKVDCAERRLRALNSEVDIHAYRCRLDSSNAEEIISQYDYVVDGCDNFATRYLIDQVCSVRKIPFVYGSISAYEGQVAVFTYAGDVSYSSLYPDKEFFSSIHYDAPPVVGSTPAVIGTIQVNQLLQLICGFGTPLVDELLVVDLSVMSFQRVSL